MESINIEEISTQFTDLFATWGPKVVGAIVVFLLGRIVANWSRRSASRVLKRSRVYDTLAPFLSSLVYYLVLAFAVIAALQLLGFQTTSFVAVLGAVALAVGLCPAGHSE